MSPEVALIVGVGTFGSGEGFKVAFLSPSAISAVGEGVLRAGSEACDGGVPGRVEPAPAGFVGLVTFPRRVLSLEGFGVGLP